MKMMIQTETPGNNANVRKAMSGKGHDVIVRTIPDGTVLEATPSKDGSWYKVEGGYVMAHLVVDAQVGTLK